MIFFITGEILDATKKKNRTIQRLPLIATTLVGVSGVQLLQPLTPIVNATRNQDNLRNEPSSRLKEPSASFLPGSLDYTLAVEPPEGYNRTQYVHSLLLQQNGKFYLAVWHEISNGDISTTPVREITPPNIPTKVTLKTSISTANI